MFGIKKLLLLLGKGKYGYLLGILGTAFAETSIYVVISFVLRDLYNAGIHTDMNLLIRAAKLIGLTILAVSLLYAACSYLYHSITRREMTRIRWQAYEIVEKLPVAYFEQKHSGETVSRMTNDMQLLEQLYELQVYTFAYTMIYGGVSAVFMLFINWQLSVLFFVIGALLLFMNVRMAKILRKLSRKIQELSGRTISRLSDLLSGLTIIRIFQMEEAAYREYEGLNQQSVLLHKKRAGKNALLESSNFLMSTISYAGLITAGAFMAVMGMVEMDQVIGMTQLMMGVTFMFQQAGNAIAALQSSLAGAERVMELLKEKPEPEVCDHLTFSVKIEEAIVIENLSFGYSKAKRVLDHINIKVKEGEFAAIVGPSGSGKSTLIKMILGFYQAESGKILVRSSDFKDPSIHSFRGLFSYVSQEVCLFNDTIEENVRYGRINATKEEIIKACKMAYAHEFIMDLEEGYRTRIGENGAVLSGGQRQRIAIARAFLRDSRFIIFDEATSALDALTEQLVQKAMMTLIRGRTALVIAHRLSVIENADKIYVMDRGRMVEHGVHQELLEAKGVYFKLHHIQAAKS